MAVWRALEAGEDPVEALRRRHPNAPPDVIARDVEAVLDALADASLLTPDAGAGSPGQGA